MSVSICGRINGEDDGFGSSLLGSLEDCLTGCVVGVKVYLIHRKLYPCFFLDGCSHLLESDLGTVCRFGGGNLLNTEGCV